MAIRALGEGRYGGFRRREQTRPFSIRPLTTQRLTRSDIGPGKWQALPEATVTAIEAVDSMSNRWPMEVIATTGETEQVRGANRGRPFVLFAEDRTRPIIMTKELPMVWTAPGVAGRAVRGEPMRGEFFPFQLGVWASVTW